MPKSKSLPHFALRVQSYHELLTYVDAFAKGHLNLLLVFGSAGIGKSRHIREAVGNDVCWIDGNASPFGIFMQAYEHRDQVIVLDDVDGLYRDRQGIRLLKTLCQTELVKTLSWQTDAAGLDRRGIAREFKTTSRVAILGNVWKSLNGDVAALEDRGHLIHFDPAPLEVHCQASRWFWDQEIFDFVAENLHLMKQHSLRTYVLAWELKGAGLDWKALILSRCLSGTALQVAKFKFDRQFEKEEDRAAAFERAGYGCRSTYFNHAKRLSSSDETPKIELSNTSPPQPSSKPPDIIALLRRRNRYLGNG